MASISRGECSRICRCTEEPRGDSRRGSDKHESCGRMELRRERVVGRGPRNVAPRLAGAHAGTAPGAKKPGAHAGTAPGVASGAARSLTAYFSADGLMGALGCLTMI